jgi:hypothetical protein
MVWLLFQSMFLIFQDKRPAFQTLAVFGGFAADIAYENCADAEDRHLCV